MRGAVARGRVVLLVEGATDAAVLTALLGEDDRRDEHDQRDGRGGHHEHGARAPLVVAAGGKHALPLAAAVAGALGAQWHVLLDGDAEGWRRSANRSRARTTHARSTERVLRALPAQRCTVLPDALEAELERWPSFVAALRRLGGELTGPAAKDPARYAAAAAAAGDADAPARLLALRRLTPGGTPGLPDPQDPPDPPDPPGRPGPPGR
ncbi:TOPRIM nucleotidyl transferase/hydrolase domain-containing protein [Kineococcus sp. SYSU DK005]|uniref:TOPRIM nucleotidyl transferase/hydrolase domain-containing protein n=1 Tax=Kineococcus sp. SYSU DK005 TaxID=3383126 RepID=UPI003D7E10DA